MLKNSFAEFSLVLFDIQSNEYYYGYYYGYYYEYYY